MSFKTLVETYFKTKLKTLYLDIRGEYQKLKSFLQSCKVQHLTTPSHTPQHNGLAKYCHRHIVENGLTLLYQAYVLPTY